MPDEFDKPLEQGDPHNYGEDAEVPLVPPLAESGTHPHDAKQETQSTRHYIRPALERLRVMGAWFKNGWIGKTLQSASFWTAAATIVIAVATIFYTIYAKRQWQEIRSGSADTHDLAVAAGKQADRTKELVDRMKEQADQTKIIARQAVVEAEAARNAAKTAADQLVLGERPWVKIKHRIVTPLTFDIGGRASGIPVALMTIEDTIENVGQTVAINVLSWEDVIPADPDHSIRTARARQKEYCDANRHPDPRGLSGSTLFPHDPSIQQSIVGPQMPKVAEATIRNGPGLNGKVAFVLVGCVFYRSSFEPRSRPTHQTRFIYWLGVPYSEGGFQPYVIPSGVAAELRLIAMLDGFTAD